MTNDSLSPVLRWTSIVAVWAATAVAAVMIAVFAGAEVYLGWLGVAMAACVLVTMCVQLGTQARQGFVARLAASLFGSFLILALATLVLWLLHVD